MLDYPSVILQEPSVGGYAYALVMIHVLMRLFVSFASLVVVLSPCSAVRPARTIIVVTVAAWIQSSYFGKGWAFQRQGFSKAT